MTSLAGSTNGEGRKRPTRTPDPMCVALQCPEETTEALIVTVEKIVARHEGVACTVEAIETGDPLRTHVVVALQPPKITAADSVADVLRPTVEAIHDLCRNLYTYYPAFTSRPSAAQRAEAASWLQDCRARSMQEATA